MSFKCVRDNKQENWKYFYIWLRPMVTQWIQKDSVDSTLYDINKIFLFCPEENGLRTSDVWLSLLWFSVTEQSIILFLETLFQSVEYPWPNTGLFFEKSSSWNTLGILISEPIVLRIRFARWTMYFLSFWSPNWMAKNLVEMSTKSYVEWCITLVHKFWAFGSVEW
jgi:hypothetical protein